jgi:hypothetical protein
MEIKRYPDGQIKSIKSEGWNLNTLGMFLIAVIIIPISLVKTLIMRIIGR